MNDLPPPGNRPWPAAFSSRSAGDASDGVYPAPTARRVLRTVRSYLPAFWLTIARRSFWRLSATLPSNLRARLHILAGFLPPDTAAVEDAYQDWIARHDRLDDRHRRSILTRIAGFDAQPLISVIMPVFNPDPAHLSAAIRSVEQQVYPAWQLCIADDASTNPAIAPLLRDAEARDPRINVVRREQNGHISAASNSALALATGAYVALFDHDDILSPRALFEVASRIVEQPDIDIVYSDEDHIDAGGRRSHPYFKPGWNPDLMLGHNLISHFGVYRRTLVERIGGFRIGFEGSQDYDLALRAVAKSRADRIVHIPEVLYHWRQEGNDGAFSKASHERCVLNGRRAVQDFVARDQPRATAVPAPVLPTFTRVIYPVPATAPLVSIVVSPSHPTDAATPDLGELMDRTDYPAVEVLVTGTGIAEAHRRKQPEAAAWTRDVRFGIVPSRNAAVEAAKGALILLLDFDVEPAADARWLQEMVSHAIRAEVGAVGAKLLNADGTVHHAGLTVGGERIAVHQFPGRQRADPGYFGHLHLVRNVTAMSSACLMVRREAFLHVGGLDEDPALAPFSDVDLCLKLMEQGYRNVWTPYAELIWHRRRRHVAEDPARTRRAASIMRKRWGDRLEADRYWNPNLSSDRARLSLRMRPRAAGKMAHHPRVRV